MENRLFNVLGKRGRKSFQNKLVGLVLSVLFVTMGVLMAIMAALVIRISTEKSKNLAYKQTNMLANNLRVELDGYKSGITMLMLDDRVQTYLKTEPHASGAYTNVTNGAYQSMKYIRNVQTNIRSLMLLRSESPPSYLYGGSFIGIGGRSDAEMIDSLLKDYSSSHKTQYGNLRFRMGTEGGERVLYLYQPLYDSNHLDDAIALLSMGVDTDFLKNFVVSGDDGIPLNICLTDRSGIILYSQNTAEIGRVLPGFGNTGGKSGVYQMNNSVILSLEVNKWEMYLVGTIPISSMVSTADLLITTLVLLVSGTLILLVSLPLCHRLVQRICRPLEDVVSKMEVVSSGDLTASMGEDGVDEEFRKIAVGFNSMVVRLRFLMERVKEDQHQLDKIRFDALQSQIQPHFLYNTLECIHWQAASNGDREASEMVKALALYYRLCLSKGRDIIPLSQELSQVRSYLLIQNMRYDNIIEERVEMDEEFLSVQLPKMTLQPLVENAIYHGIRSNGGKRGFVLIRAQRDDPDVLVFVEDNGVGMSPERVLELNRFLSQEGEEIGYGVRNVHRRIRLVFGERFGLHYQGNAYGGTTVVIRLPGKKEEGDIV